ncbi:MAG: GFA family protein [Caulobacteraceae bacterium]|nr:GFA family protein [Caulobacteraceae bacterium]
MTAMLTGRCLCGAVRFEAIGPPKWTGYCHCESCRRHTGAPVSAYAGFEREAVSWPSDQPVRHASSAGVFRGFCARCGSTLTYEGERWPTEVHLHAGAFDDPAAVPPQGEVHTEERIAWLHLALPARDG